MQLALLGGQKIREKPFPKHPLFGDEEKKEILEVLETGNLSGFIAKAGDFFLGGPKVRKLEKLFCNTFASPYAIAVNSATAGLHAGLAACGVGPGDEVIVTPYTMSASATAVLMCQGVPRFADIQDDVFALDPAAVEKAINKRTKAIVAVHLFGHPAPMEEILAIAKKHQLYVIEDCAQAPGVKYKEKYVGTLGDVGVFSFNQHKTITTGEGGVVLAKEKEIALKVQLIRNHGEAVVPDMNFQDVSNTVGWNYRMTELEAAVGIAQFQKLPKLHQHREDLARVLTEGLKKFDWLTLPTTYDGCTHGYFLYAMRYHSEKLEISRETLIKAIQAEGVLVGAGYVKPLYYLPVYQQQIAFGTQGWPFTSIPENERPSYKAGLCPVSERMHEKELIHTHLCYAPVSELDMKDVIAAFEKVEKSIDELKEYESAGRKEVVK